MKTRHSQAVVWAFCLIALLMQGCRNAETPDDTCRTQEYTLPAFRNICSDMVGNIEITQAPDCTVSAYGPENLLADLTVTAQDGTLQIEIDKKWKKLLKGKFNRTLTVRIALPDLQSLTVNGVEKVNMKGECDFNRLSICHTGVNKVQCDALRCKELQAKLIGVADIRLQGRCDKAFYSGIGVGEIHAKEMQSEETTAELSGVGSILCRASQTVHTRMNGIGNITVYGNPPHVHNEQTGIGKVKMK